jgi:hypothetical protein
MIVPRQNPEYVGKNGKGKINLKICIWKDSDRMFD